MTAPEGSLVNALPPAAAVAAGNVETSSRIVDVLFRAFGRAIPVPAQGQGTVNNVTFGNDTFTYYETIGGGQGACPDADGPVGRARRDVEHPLDAGGGARSCSTRCASSATRSGAGRVGTGRDRGGDGVVRELRALEPAACRCSATGAATARRRRWAVSPPGRTLVNGEEVPGRTQRRRRPRTGRRAAAATGDLGG